MKKRSGVTHAIAQCLDCDWDCECPTNALANGAKHARSTGHTVSAEQAIGVTYNPKDEEDQ